MKSFVINVGEGCRVWFCELENLGNFVKGGKAIIISNKSIYERYGANVRESLEASHVKNEYFEVPTGEGAKTFETLMSIYEALFKGNYERNDYVIALGGGSVGDVAGFAAATFKRGVNLASIPTTLLAQADSCIGGKTAINYMGVKNMIGVFYQPKFVLIDTSLLRSLPEREVKNGLMEIVKHAMINDEELLVYLEENIEKIKKMEAMEKVLWKSCRIKGSIVEKDEKDRSTRLLLNYGHTVGHAIEAASGYEISHGEAVSMGMNYEAMFAEKQGLMKKEDVERQRRMLIAIGMRIESDDKILKDAIKLLEMDKKIINGELRMALPKAIGKAVVKPVSVQELEKFLEGQISEK
ncbi:MAG: 3-dehydroquinate synthase [Candidatus Aenigmarchaeota archaeon]|nr:3-dehydroquinate synthase [Candidatus Aenigmarchaeota archaeon]